MSRKPHEDLSGKIFGNWTVLCRADDRIVRGNRHIRMWKCCCVCGTERDVLEKSLVNGVSQSCGCVRKEKMREGASKKNRTHGMSGTRLYAIYKHMLNRCYNEHDVRYPRYGGRGISVCDEWRESFEVFMDWSIKNGYAEDLSIDRIDVNGFYCPDNCKWSTAKEQADNKSSTRYYTYNGETKNISQWAEQYNIPYKRLWKRLTNGWDIERALFT